MSATVFFKEDPDQTDLTHRPSQGPTPRGTCPPIRRGQHPGCLLKRKGPPSAPSHRRAIDRHPCPTLVDPWH